MRTVLSANRNEALEYLHINPTHKLKRDEGPIFQLYLNCAVNNICEITGIADDTTSNGIVNALKAKGHNIIRQLASFFWLFRAAEPEKNFPDYEAKTIAIARKIFELREYFAHLNKNGVNELVVDQDFYRFVGGVLLSQALLTAGNPGLHSAKLFKMKLFALRDKEMQLYDFTRRGLIFLITLALYKDDAWEFTQCLEDMKIPNCPKGCDIQDECSCQCEDIASCKPGVAKAFAEVFTYFSTRRGRSVNLLEDDFNYISFANISGYLNKVPDAAADYLTLDAENRMLRKKYDASTESEDNKKYKYTLHRRAADRFLSLATAYAEDFGRLPSLKFKRQDISMEPGRKRYFFGVEHDNRVHMDRHYQISRDAVHFAWNAKKHYGDIHIDSLRSSLSASAMRDLLFAGFCGCPVDKYVNEYFTAYHRILETVINKLDTDDLFLQDAPFCDDFTTVSGIAMEEIEQNVLLLNKYFPGNLTRFFSGDDAQCSDETLRAMLLDKIENQIHHAQDFLTRKHKLDAWKLELAEKRKSDPAARLPHPVCAPGEVHFPPFDCEMSDNLLIAQVFKYFNLYLENDQKFRQLPPGEEHRGELDHEYQFVHTLIGKYALDPKGLEYFITKRKPELCPAWDRLTAELGKLRSAAMKKRPPKYNKYGKPIKPLADLAMLAEAAQICRIEYLKEKFRCWETSTSGKREQLYKICRKFGIRPGMPLDRNSLIKTVLRIDLSKWMNAYNYETHSRYENRSLDQGGHIVSQIPFPADFGQRIMRGMKKPELQKFFKTGTDGEVSFDFPAAIREMPMKFCLRDYYDVAPLVSASVALRDGIDIENICGLKIQPDEGRFPADFSRNAVRKAIVRIKDARHQDLILARAAFDYWNAFQEQGAFICAKKKEKSLADPARCPSIYEYFDAAVQLKFADRGDERKILIMPNDVNRPILSQIRKYAPVIAKVMDPSGSCQEFEFYEMLKVYREIQAGDRRARLSVLPLLNKFDHAGNIPQEKYENCPDIHAMEYDYFVKRFPALTRDEYEYIVSRRNRVFHNDLNIDLGDLEQLLKKYVSIAAPASRFHGKKTWGKRF